MRALHGSRKIDGEGREKLRELFLLFEVMGQQVVFKVTGAVIEPVHRQSAADALEGMEKLEQTGAVALRGGGVYFIEAVGVIYGEGVQKFVEKFFIALHAHHGFGEIYGAMFRWQQGHAVGLGRAFCGTGGGSAVQNIGRGCHAVGRGPEAQGCIKA